MEGLSPPSWVLSLSFSAPFACIVKVTWGPPSVTENPTFTEIQEESAGVNQSLERAGDLTADQPHWVSHP